MSYCTLDEAFNTDFLNNQNQNQNQNCVKKQRVKRTKVNCNAKKNRFNRNKEDIMITSNYDSSHTFDNGLLGDISNDFQSNDFQSNDSQSNDFQLNDSQSNDYLSGFQLVENFQSSPPRRPRTRRPPLGNTGVAEGFQNSNSNSNSNNKVRVKRQNSNNNSNYNPNEVFEYSPEDNRPLPDSSENYVIENSDDEEEEIIVKKRPKRKNNNEELNSQISEINNKISFIMNQINKEEEPSNSNETLENNIHDIILFVIFGAFIILLLESFFKFIIKIHAKEINL